MKKVILFSSIFIMILIHSGFAGDLVINEVLFNPSGADTDEWIEIYVQTGGTDLGGWLITNQNGDTLSLPSFTPSTGDYIIFHTGNGIDDLSGPNVYHVYADSASEIWSDSGDDILIFQDDGTTGVDYIAYGTGTNVEGAAGGLSWTTNIDTTGLNAGDVLALVPDGTDNDEGVNWHVRSDITQGESNNPELTVTHTGIATMTRNDTDGEDFSLIVKNTGNVTVDDVRISNLLPDSLYLHSTTTVEKNGSSITYSVSDDADSVHWYGFSDNTLAPGDSIEISYKLKSGCNVAASITNTVVGYGEDESDSVYTASDDHNISITTTNDELGKLTINEVLFNPTTGDSQWVEIYVSEGDNINNWQITNRNGASYEFPDKLVVTGEYIVFHTGTGDDDLVGPVYHFYAGVDTAFFNPTGDDIYIQEDSGNEVDYIAYGSGSAIDGPACDIPWTDNIDISSASAGDAIALVQNAQDIDNGTNWRVRSDPNVSQGVTNDPYPSIYLETIETQHDKGDTAGDWYSIRIVNTGGSSLENISVRNLYDAGWDYHSTEDINIGSTGLTYNTSVSSPDSVIWNNMQDGGSPISLAPGDTLYIDHFMKTDCSLVSGTYTNPVKVFGEDDAGNAISRSRTFAHEVVEGNLVLEVVAIEKNGVPISPTPSVTGTLDDTLTIKVRLKNTGEGSLFDVEDSTSWFSGFEYVAGSVQGDGVTDMSGSGYFEVYHHEIQAYTDTSFTFKIRVGGCDNLSVPSSAIEPCLSDPETVTAGLTFILKQPDMDIDYPGIIDVTLGDSVLVEVPIENVGPGHAYNFTIGSNLEEATAVDIFGIDADWSYDSGTGEFSYLPDSGTYESGAKDTLSFYVRPDDYCSNSGFNYNLIWEPVYESPCQDSFFTPTGIDQIISSVRTDILSITKKSNDAGGTLQEGDSYNYSITVDLTDTTRIPQDSLITITDDIDSRLSINSITGIGNVSTSGQEITWELTRGEAFLNPTLDIGVTVQTVFTNPCSPQNSTISNAAQLSAHDFHNCPITLSDGDGGVSIQRNPAYDDTTLCPTAVDTLPDIEVCHIDTTLTVSVYYVFGVDVSGNWTGTDYEANIDNTYLDFVANSMDFAITDSSGVQDLVVDSTGLDPTSGPIDLDFIASLIGQDDLIRGDSLLINWDVTVKTTSSGDIPGDRHNAEITHTANFAGNNGSIGSATPGEYINTNNLWIERAGADLGLNLITGVGEGDGDTITVNLDMNVNNFPADSAIVYLSKENFSFYEIVEYSTELNSLSKDTTSVGDSLRFRFYDPIPVGNHYIRVRMIKGCLQPNILDARMRYKDNCDSLYSDPESINVPETSNITLDINMSRNTIDDCDTISVDIDVGINTWAADNVIIRIDTLNYVYLDTISVTGFDGLTPTVSAVDDSIEFSFAGQRLSSTSGTIRVLMQKICSATTSTAEKILHGRISWDNSCGTATSYRTDSFDPLLNRKAKLSVVFTPEDLTVEDKTPDWVIYVTNRGSGVSFNTALYDSVGEHLRVDSVWVNEAVVDSITTINRYSDRTIIEIDLGDIPDGDTDTIRVFTSLKGTSCDLEDLNKGVISLYNGCPGDCSLPIIKSGIPRFLLPDSNLRIRNTAPDDVTLCSKDTLMVQLTNNGASHDYNIEVEYNFLETGFKYMPGTTEYSLNGGSKISVAVDPDSSAAGDTLWWDRSHISILEDMAVDDVLEIYFEVQTSCDFSENRQTSAIARYSTPCQVDTLGNSVDTEVSLSSSISIDILEPQITVNKDVRRGTSGDWSDIVYASLGDTVQFRIQIGNSNEANSADAENVALVDTLPSNLTFESITKISGPDLDTPTITDTIYKWPLLTDLAKGATAEYILETTVNDCKNPVTNTADAFWGCNATACQELNYSETNGSVVTRPSVAGATSVVSSDDFNTCGGEMRVVVTNDTTNSPSAVARNIVVRDTLPDGFVYDLNTATVTSNITGRPAFSAAQQEPDSIAGFGYSVIEWTQLDTIIPGEELTITFRVKSDSTAGYCDDDLYNDPPPVPTSNNVVSLEYKDTCGNPIPSDPAATTVNPKTPNADIEITPVSKTATEGQELEWTVTVYNTDDGPADSLYLMITMGDGFSSISQSAGSTGGADSLGAASINQTARTLYWNAADIDTIYPGGSKTAKFKATIGAGALDIFGVVEGWCVNNNGDRICRHSYDTTPAVISVAGIDLKKVHFSAGEPASIAADSLSAIGSIGTVITQRISANYFGVGDYEDTKIVDILPEGMAYVSGTNSVVLNETPATITLDDSAPEDSLVWTVSDFTNNSGEIVVEYDVVIADSATVADGDTLWNTAYTDATIDSVTFSHTDPDFADDMQKSIWTAIEEPEILDINFTKTSSDTGVAKLVKGGDNVIYTLKAINTGTSPAYEVTFQDTLPIGMRNTIPTIDSVGIGSDTNPRELTLSNDYDTTYVRSTGILTMKTVGDSTTHGGLAPDDTLFLVYTVTIDDSVGAGATMINKARVASYTSILDTVPEERIYSTAVKTDTLITQGATISATDTTQQSPPGYATIGEVITYTYRINVPKNTVLYDPRFETRYQDGLILQDVDIIGGTNGAINAINVNGTRTQLQIDWDKMEADSDGDTVYVVTYVSVADSFSDGSAPTGWGGRDDNSNGRVDTGDDVLNQNQGGAWNVFYWNYIDNDTNTQQTIDDISNIFHDIMEPELTSFNKTYSVAPDTLVQGREEIQFTLSFENIRTTAPTDSAHTSPAYEVVVVDTIPFGMREKSPLTLSPLTVEVNTTPLTQGVDYNVSWDDATGALEFEFVDSVAVEGVVDINYKVVVDSTVGFGAVMSNHASILSYTSIKDTATYKNDTGGASSSEAAPERVYPVVGPDSLIFTTEFAEVHRDSVWEQQSPDDKATIGEELKYYYRIIVPEEGIAYDAAFRDTIPDRLTVQEVLVNGGSDSTITIDSEVDGRTPILIKWAEILGDANGDTVYITITTTVDSLQHNGSEVLDGQTITTGDAKFNWNYIDGDTTNTKRTITSPTDEQITVEIIEPVLNGLSKTHTDPAGDIVEGTQTVDFSVSFNNSGNSAAYETVFQDTLPIGMRDNRPTNVSVEIGGEIVSDANYDTTYVENTGILTLNFLSATEDSAIITNGDNVVIRYTVTVDDTVGLGALMVNSATIKEYTSMQGTPLWSAKEKVYPQVAAVHDTLSTESAVVIRDSVWEEQSPDEQGTIGEELKYYYRITLPEWGVAYDAAFRDTIPDRLTVQEVIVNGGIDSTITFSEEADGTTPVEIKWEKIVAEAAGDTVYITITTTVDSVFYDGTEVLDGQTITTGDAYFNWNYIDGDTTNTRRIINTPSGEQISVQIIEPVLDNFTKTHTSPSGTVVEGKQKIKFKLRFENTGNSSAYEAVIADTLPFGMRDTAPTVDTVRVNTTELTEGVNDDYQVDWTRPVLTVTLDSTAVAEIAVNDSVIIRYTATVDDTVGSAATMTNSAGIKEYTSMQGVTKWGVKEKVYPAVTPDSETFTTPISSILSSSSEQQSAANQATIGETVTYTYEIRVPQNTVAYEAYFRTRYHDGLVVQEVDVNGGVDSTITVTPADNDSTQIEVDWAKIMGGVDGDTVFVIVNTSVDSGYIDGSAPPGRDDNSNGIVDNGDDMENRATYFNWAAVDGGAPAWTLAGGNIGGEGDVINHEIIEPNIPTITKLSSTEFGNAYIQGGEEIYFRLIFENDGNSGAHETVVADTLPVGMRNTDPSGTVAITSSTGEDLTGDFSTNWDGGTGVLTISLNTTADAVLEPSEEDTITYTATVDATIGSNVTISNCADVLSYTSMGNVSDYETVPGSANGASVTPERVYPNVGSDCNTFVTIPPVHTKSLWSEITSQTEADTINAQIGEEVTFKVSYIVPINTNAYDAEFRDTIPDGFTVTEVTSWKNGASFGTPSYSEDTDGTTPIEVPDLADLNSEDSVAVFITANVDSQYINNSDIDSTSFFRNQAEYYWNRVDNDDTTIDSLTSNWVRLDVVQPYLEDLQKGFKNGVDPNPVEGTREVEYEITFQNTGVGKAYDIVVNDTIPYGMRDTAPTVDSVQVDGTDIDYSNVNWSSPIFSLVVDSLDIGDSVHIYITSEVDQDIGSAASMQNKVSIEEYTTLPGTRATEKHYENTEVATELVYTEGLPTQFKRIESFFTDADTSLTCYTTIGDTVIYYININVPSNTTAYQCVLTDTLPDGVTYVRATGVDKNDCNIIYNIAELDIGDGRTELEIELGTNASCTAAPSNNNLLGDQSGNAYNPYIVNIYTNVDSVFGTDGTGDNNTNSIVDDADVLSNQAVLGWNVVDGGLDGTPDTPDTTIASNIVSSTIIEPKLENISKYVIQTIADRGSVDGDSIVVPTSEVVYEVVFENNGTANAYNVTLRDTLPQYMRDTRPSINSIEIGSRTLTTGDTTTTYVSADGEYKIEFETPDTTSTAIVKPGETVTLTYTATVNDEILAASDSLDNRVDLIDYSSLPSPGGTRLELERDTDSPAPYADLGPVSDRVIIQPVLMDKTPDGTLLRIGDEQDYAITMTLGPQTRTYYPYLRDVLPLGTRMVESTIDDDAGDITLALDTANHPVNPIVDSLNAEKRQIYNWYFDTVANSDKTNDQTIAVNYTVEVTGKNTLNQNQFLNLLDTDIENFAEFNWNYLDHSEYDSTTHDRQRITDSVTNTVVQPRLSVTKTKLNPSGVTVAAGDVVEYQLEICNNGNDPARAYDISVSDILPLGMRDTDPFDMTYSTVNAIAPTVTHSYDSDIGEARWQFSGADSLQPDSCLVITYSAQVDNDVLTKVSPSDSLSNQAQVDTFYSHPTASYRRQYAPQLADPVSVYLGGIYITPDRQSSVGPGTAVFYQHIVANLGGSSDEITFNIENLQGPDWEWSIYYADENGNPDGFIGEDGATLTLSAGERDTIVVRTFVPTDTPQGTINSTKFTIVSEHDSEITSSVTDITTVGLPSAGNLRLTKEVDQPTATPGDTLTYTITYQNVGRDTIYDVTLSDPVSEHVSLVSDAFNGTHEIRWTHPDGTTIDLTEEIDGDAGHYNPERATVDVNFSTGNVGDRLQALPPGASGTVIYKVEIK